MLTNIRWYHLKNLDNIVLGRRGQKANKRKEKEGNDSSSKTKDDEAGGDKRLAIETDCLQGEQNSPSAQRRGKDVAGRVGAPHSSSKQGRRIATEAFKGCKESY